MKSLLLCVCIGFSQLMISTSVPSQQIPDEFHRMGTVEGKTFFYDNTTLRNWFEARQACVNIGMRLAVIKSKVQNDFLTSKPTVDGFFGEFWIGGRDAQSSDQFRWDITDEPEYPYNSRTPANAKLDYFGQPWGFYSILTCLTVYPVVYPHSPIPQMYWSAIPCDKNVFTLCETV